MNRTIQDPIVTMQLFTTETDGDAIEGIVVTFHGTDSKVFEIEFTNPICLDTTANGMAWASELFSVLVEEGMDAAVEMSDELAGQVQMTFTNDELYEFLEEPNE